MVNAGVNGRTLCGGNVDALQEDDFIDLMKPIVQVCLVMVAGVSSIAVSPASLLDLYLVTQLTPTPPHPARPPLTPTPSTHPST